MFHKSKNIGVPSDAQAKEKLALYVYEYLTHVGAPKAAQTFFTEIQWDRTVQLSEPPGFLFSWWSVFWDLYCAAPERRDTTEHSNEAKAFHDYGFINSGPSNGFIPGSPRMNKMVSIPPEHNFRGRMIPMNHTRFSFPHGPFLFGPDGQRLRLNCVAPFASNNIPMMHRQQIPDMRQLLSNGPPNSNSNNFYSKNIGPHSGIPPRHPQLIFSPMNNFSPPPSLFRSGVMDQSQLNSNSDQSLLFMPPNRCDSRNPLSNQLLSSDANSIELALTSMSNHPYLDSQQNSFFPNSIENSLANNSTPLTMINDTSSSSIMDEPSSHMPPLNDEEFLTRIGHRPPNLLQHSNSNLNNCEQNLSPFINHSSSPFHQNHMKFLPGSGFPADINGLGEAVSASFNNHLPSGINVDIITAFSDLSNQSLGVAAFHKMKSNFSHQSPQKIHDSFNFNFESTSGSDQIY